MAKSTFDQANLDPEFADTELYAHHVPVFSAGEMEGLTEAPGHLVEFQTLQIGQLGPGKRMGKDLVVAIEITLAFDQDGPAGRVKLGQRSDQPGLEGAVQG